MGVYIKKKKMFVSKYIINFKLHVNIQKTHLNLQIKDANAGNFRNFNFNPECKCYMNKKCNVHTFFVNVR